MADAAATPRATFRARCGCGAVAEGERRARPQAVACSGCGRRLFVFGAGASGDRPARPPAMWKAWRYPLLAAALCVAVLCAAAGLLLPYLSRQPAREPSSPPTAEEAQARAQSGRKLMGEGKFHLALADLNAALRARRQAPGAMSAARWRELSQLRRQASLLSRLSPVLLEDIIRQARFVGGNPDEWAAHWELNYAGRSVLFDAPVRRDELGRPAFTARMVVVDGEEVRVALEGLVALQDLPLDGSPRLIFGARLERCRREEGGRWAIHLEPDSGALITDLPALEAACAVKLDDGAKEAVRRQARWVEQFSPASQADR